MITKSKENKEENNSKYKYKKIWSEYSFTPFGFIYYYNTPHHSSKFNYAFYYKPSESYTIDNKAYQNYLNYFNETSNVHIPVASLNEIISSRENFCNIFNIEKDKEIKHIKSCYQEVNSSILIHRKDNKWYTVGNLIKTNTRDQLMDLLLN